MLENVGLKVNIWFDILWYLDFFVIYFCILVLMQHAENTKVGKVCFWRTLVDKHLI